MDFVIPAAFHVLCKSESRSHQTLQPDFSVDKIHSVTASHPSPYGVIRSSYTHQDGFIVWTVSIPANTTGEVHLPNGKIKKIGSGDWTFRIKG